MAPRSGARSRRRSTSSGRSGRATSARVGEVRPQPVRRAGSTASIGFARLTVMSRTESSPAQPGGEPRSVPALVRLLRPRQWAKNVLVFAAPGAAGVLDDPTQLGKTLVAFVAFCLAASGAYCLNDASDAEADRLHPEKRFRPVAAGAVSVTAARRLGVGLLVAGTLVSLLVGNLYLLAAVGAYLAVTSS